MIKVEHIDKYFYRNKRQEVHVLNDISIDFPTQGLVILSGDSGSGKTTLLNVLGGLDKVDKGTLQLDDVTIAHYKNDLWNQLRRNKIGYIFQNYYLIPTLSVFDNIAVSLRLIGIQDEAIIKQNVDYILHQVGMYKFRKRLSNQLSGGQQQRVAIARALVKNPDVVIADEPTGNLDSKNTIEIMNIIKKISSHRLVVLVTHEKELAQFYGDRIIHIQDGKIVSDTINTPVDTYEVEETDTVYLQDFKHISQNDNISYYSNDTDMDLQNDVNVSLIYKNGTLLLDVSGVAKKVKLVTPDSGITVLNKKYTRQEKEAIMQTDFSLDVLQHETIRKYKETLFTFRENVRSAFLKLLKMTKVEKVMLIGFFVTGVITAFAASILGNELFADYINPGELENYVTFNKQALNLDYDLIASFGEDDEDFFINVYENDHINITIPSSKSYNRTYDLKGELDIIEHVQPSDVVYGRLPENDFEFVVDIKSFNRTNGPYSTLAKYGIWEASHLIGEKVLIKDWTFTVVGIVDTGSMRIYGTRSGISVMSYNNKTISQNFLSLEFLGDDIVLVDGQLPEPGSKEILVPASWVGKFVPEWAFDVEEYDYRGQLVAGSYDDSEMDLGYLPFIGHNIDIEFYIFRNTIIQMDVYSSHPEQLLERMQEANLVAEWKYGTAVLEAENSSNSLVSILYISIFILLFSGLGVYYMMRSSMLSRIYNISVFRALGVEQKSIRREFILEIFLITSWSTLFGYLLTCLVIFNIQGQSYLKDIAYLNIPSMMFGIIIIYVINFVFGLFSIQGQLNKTPSELLSNYDM